MAIQIRDHNVVKRLFEIVHEDWKNARELDLSDHGLQRDLEKHSEEGELSRVGVITSESSADGAARD